MTPGPGDQQADEKSLPAQIAAAGAAEDLGLKQRARAIAAMVPKLTASARQAGFRAVTAGRWLSEVVLEVAPHVVVRDASALRRQHPGESDEEISARLIAAAARTTAAIGAAAGSLAAVEFTAPPALLAAPIQLAAESVAVVAVELRLVAELHEVAGLAVPGPMHDSAAAYLSAWIHRRPARPGETLTMSDLVGGAARRELRLRLLKRMGRSATSMAPFLAGAVAGAEVNRRATRDLGERLRAELRGMQHKRADVVIEAPGSGASRD